MEQEIKKTEDSPIPVSIKGTEIILSQMKKCLCTINSKEIETIGFFCKFPYTFQQKFFTALITKNSVLNSNLSNKTISLKFYNENESREIIIDKSRKVFPNKTQDLAIIEIKPEKDKINLENFLELDENIKNPDLNNIYTKSSIYILHSPKSGYIEVSYGILTEIKEGEIYHNCSIEKSSFAPILNLSNFKLIGIHQETEPSPESNLKKGCLMKYLELNSELNDKPRLKKVVTINSSTNENNNNNIKSENNKKIKDNLHLKTPNSKEKKKKMLSSRSILNKLFLSNNLMTIKYLIKEEKKIQIFGRDFVKRNKGKCKIIINNTEQELYQYLDTKNLNDIKSIEIKLIEIKTITDMSKMFSNCIWLYALPDISKWDMCLVTNMSFMFSCCLSLTNFEGISKWDISNVTDISYMFWGCSTFKMIPDISNWNTSSVIDMSYMFNRCSLLFSLPDISKWNTEKVVHMEYMFNKCSELKAIPDLSKWNINKVTDMRGIFKGCKNLIEIPENFKGA
jgi:surface protein